MLCMAAIVAASSPARAERIVVVLDQAEVMQLPDGTKTVIVGNPAIADVAVMPNGKGMVITGKSYGTTNLVALDGAGLIVAKSSLYVQAPVDSVVVVQRGLERESYSCTPRCAPALVPGDSKPYFTGVGEQSLTRNQLSTPGLPGAR